MELGSPVEQETINRVWEREWVKKGYASKKIFNHRLFVEGYPVFRKYIPEHSERILEVGGGTGRYGIGFAREFPAAKILITDILEESLDVTKKIADEVGARNVQIQKEDVMHLSFPSDTFDVVFSDELIQHISAAERAVSEMARVLKPGGTLIVSANNVLNIHTLVKKILGKKYRYGYERSYTPNELGALALSAGCNITALDGFYPAYGIYRLKEYWRPFGTLGRALNRLNKLIDPWTGRFFSRRLGFEIFVVAIKK